MEYIREIVYSHAAVAYLFIIFVALIFISLHMMFDSTGHNAVERGTILCSVTIVIGISAYIGIALNASNIKSEFIDDIYDRYGVAIRDDDLTYDDLNKIYYDNMSDKIVAQYDESTCDVYIMRDNDNIELYRMSNDGAYAKIDETS